jgi:hypothetical protein
MSKVEEHRGLSENVEWAVFTNADAQLEVAQEGEA